MRYIKSFLLIALTVGIVSCDVLDQSPRQNIDSEEVFTSQQGALNALRGVYGGLQGPIQEHLMFTELMSPNAGHSGSFPTWGEINNLNVLTNNVTASNFWRDMYNVVNRANNVIAYVPQVEDEAFTQAQRNAAIGEAHVLRAYVFFSLAKFYANNELGIPLPTSPTVVISEDNNIPRATLQATYNQIESDLLGAIDLLDGTKAISPAASTVNAHVARALLARVYLHGADLGVFPNGYAQARDYSAAVINSAVYTLSPSYRDIFQGSQGNAEVIWELVYSSEDSNSLSFYARPNGQGGRREYAPTGGYFGLFAPGDTRSPVNVMFVNPENDQPFAAAILGKYYRIDGSDNIAVIRLAEMMLVHAEALAHTDFAGEGRTALDLVNDLRVRAGVAPYDFDTDVTSVDDLLEIIWLERRLELGLEGHAWHDFNRTGRAVSELGVNPNMTRWPIPEREMDVNPGLAGQQNPGY